MEARRRKPADHYTEKLKSLTLAEIESARREAEERLSDDLELRFWADEGEPREDAFTTLADGSRRHLSDNHLFISSVLTTLELL